MRLIEVTHGQWCYRNMHVHDATAGMEVTARKKAVQRFVEDQLEMVEEGMDKRDGEDQHYWLLQIEAVRYDLVLQRQNNDSNNRNHREGERAYDYFLIKFPGNRNNRL